MGRSTGIAGVGIEDIDADEELEEGRDAGEASADGNGRGFTTREADAMGEGEHVLSGYLIRSLLERAEEVTQNAVVGVWSAVGA